MLALGGRVTEARFSPGGRDGDTERMRHYMLAVVLSNNVCDGQTGVNKIYSAVKRLLSILI